MAQATGEHKVTSEEGQIRIHTKRADTTRGKTGESSVETINAHTVTSDQIDEAVKKHFELEEKVIQAIEGDID